MALGREGRFEGRNSTRDYEADFRVALIAEYESYANNGLDDRAAEVAKELKKLGHEVKVAKGDGAKERAVPTDGVETTVESSDVPAPKRGRPKKAAE